MQPAAATNVGPELARGLISAASKLAPYMSVKTCYGTG